MINIKELKDKTIKVLLFFNTLSVIYIPCLGHYVDNITIYYFIVNITTFILLLALKPKIKISGFFKYIFIYYLILIISTIFNKGTIMPLLFEGSTTLFTILIWNSLEKEEFKKYLKVLTFTLELLTYANLLIIFAFPNGLYNVNAVRKYYLFDHVNVSIRYLLPGTCFSLINSVINNNKFSIRNYIYVISVIITLILTRPMTAIVGYIIFLISLLLIFRSKLINKTINPFYSHLASFLISYLIIFFNFQQHFLRFIGVLERDLTFTGRTYIWDKTLYNISYKPFMGYGRLSAIDRQSYINATSAHNQFLNFTFEGGLLLLSNIFITLFIISKKLKKCNNNKIVCILSSTFISYAVMWITEPFSYSGTSLMFIIWLITYYSPILFNEKKGLENE